MILAAVSTSNKLTVLSGGGHAERGGVCADVEFQYGLAVTADCGLSEQPPVCEVGANRAATIA
jgi:hypothetical protein